ncbi:MAG: RHS repeat-associated core domain-containing protein [Lachnospiraceae bacterium]|nr:RHS repeat-associated core domain-containing protein [Lachnospiraceae bacterium]
MGNTLFLLGQDHEIRKTYRYDAFENLLKETGSIPNRLTCVGQIYDGAAIQYYLRARFYNSAIGRFMQEDTYRGDGLNLYEYCANNPVIYYDPSGRALCLNEKTVSRPETYEK